MQNPFPAATFRENFKAHFQQTDLAELFDGMCDLIEGTFDPWERVHDLKLRFYEFDEEDFDFDDWLINAGQYILIVKTHAMLHKEAGAGEIERLCKQFQETLNAIKPDFLEDENHYYYAFSVLAELLKTNIVQDLSESRGAAVQSYLDAKLDELAIAAPATKRNALPLIVPYILDAIQIHPESLACLLGILDRIRTALDDDPLIADDILGICIRTLAFKDYKTRSSDALFAWARDHCDRVTEPFTKTTSMMHVAIGHSLRGEQGDAEALFAAVMESSEALPSPRKEIHVAFIMRCCIEAGITSGAVYDQAASLFQDMTETTIDRIHELNVELNSEEEKDDARVETMLQEMEAAFIVFSGILDNLALTGLHARNDAFLAKVEVLIERVKEVNITINFKTKLAVYYQIGSEKREKPLELVKEIAETIGQEVENIFLEDLEDFFIDFSRNCLELSFLTGDPAYIDVMNTVYMAITGRKNLGDEDMETFRYQVLSSMNSLLATMWNAHFGMNLLQGGSAF